MTEQVSSKPLGNNIVDNDQQKTLVFATSYMRDAQSWQDRYEPWFQYYRRSALGHMPLVLIDDGSPFIPNHEQVDLYRAQSQLDPQPGRLSIIRFTDNLGRSSLTSYPGWWRSFLYAATLAQQTGYDKIIHIESDAYILSERFYSYLANIRQGWTTFWLPTYQMPETAIQVICKDQYDNMLEIREHPKINCELAEKFLPFTHIDKGMKGDRYSEFKRNRWIFRSKKFDRFPPFKTDFFFAPIPQDCDFATQVVQRQLRDIRFRNAHCT